MSEVVKKKVKVIGAQYSREAKCVVLLVEASDGRFYSQLHLQDLLPNVTNWHQFKESDVIKCANVFCNEIIGKEISVVFDPDLNDKLKDHYPLKYD